MSARSVMLRGRRAAEALMVDSCVITRKTGQTLNQSTGAYTDTTDTIYSGKCQVVKPDGAAVDVNAGERDVAVSSTKVKLPITATGIQSGDKVTLTATFDADMTGRVVYVHEVQTRTFGTSRRLACEEQQP